jgi:hypothetical protein
MQAFKVDWKQRVLKAAVGVLAAAALLAVGSPGAVAGEPEGLAGAQFVNGNFDDGPWVGWTEFSKLNFDVIVTDFGEGISAQSNPYAAWLGGIDTEQAWVEQAVSITAATPVLRYWHWTDSDESGCAFDLARVYAGGAIASTLGLCKSTNTGGWVVRKVDLSAFEGHTLPIRLQVDTDGSLTSSQYIDDVALEANPLGPLSVTASKNGSLVRLTWGHASPYTGYEVWRSQSPYFLIGEAGSEKRGDLPAPVGATASFDDAGATGNVGANIFYVVRGAGSDLTRVSNRTGEFDFSLVKGS